MVVGLAMMQASCVNTEHASPPHVAAVKDSIEVAENVWPPLAEDALHDPKNLGIKLLQEPGTALATLPANKSRLSVGSYQTVGPMVNKDGNKVDWVQALIDGIISPRRARTAPGTGVEQEELVMDMDMYLDIGGSMPIVRFPHLAHTIWLACSNCHSAIFLPQSGANPLSMEKILSGEQCGICHRAVSFPPTDCARCHSVGHNSPEGIKLKAEARARTEARAKLKAEAEARAEAVARAKVQAPTKVKAPAKAKVPAKKVGERP